MKTIAVIGSRKMTSYGKEVVAKLIPLLVRNDFGIVTARTGGVNMEVARLAGIKAEVISGDNFEKINLEMAQKADRLIVIEGGRNSGTILVAKAFLDLGKEVWAVPGKITDENSWATNFLISNGAGVLTGDDMIFEPVTSKR